MLQKAVIQIVGFKNSGKTETSCEMIRRFVEKGWEVGSIKHDAHHFEVDYPGKDTWKHREAGASVVAITSQQKTAIMEQRSSSLQELIDRIHKVDVVIVEGYKFADFPKVVIIRSEEDLHLLDETTQIVAISTWFPYEHPTIPVFEKDDYERIFHTILQQLNDNAKGRTTK